MKVVWFLMLAMALAMPVFAANASALGGSLTLNTLRYTPYPAEPGQYFDVWFDVFASEAQQGVYCKLLPGFPFSIDASEDASRSLSLLQGKQSWLLKYKVRTAPDAILGPNPLRFGCGTSHSQFVSTNFSVYVQPSSGNLAIDSVASVPQKAGPGRTVRLGLVLKNSAGAYFRNVRVSLSLSDPFVPIGSGSEKLVDRISAGASQEVSFDLSVAPSAESKAYRIPVAITFEDAAGAKYSLKDTVGVQVGAQPSVSIQLRDSNILRPDALGKVTIKVINGGPEAVKFLSVKLGDSDAYQAVSGKSVYVGSVASDDFETAEFSIYVLKPNPSLKLSLQYKDASNEAFVTAAEVSVPTYAEEQIRLFQLEKKQGVDPLLMLVGLAVLAYAAYWAFKKWGKRK